MYFWTVGELEKDFHTVELENLALTGLADLIGVEKLELADTFVVVVLDADASTPLLNLSRLGPESDIYRFWSVQYQSCC